MSISDIIEQMLIEMLGESGGSVEIQRNTLAGKLNCVPSQINYVIQTRFTPERGYSIESRRGGGGGVRISRISYDGNSYVMHLVNVVGSRLDFSEMTAFLRNLCDYGILSRREARLVMAALSDNVLPQRERDAVRAAGFKNLLVSLIKE
ncbi:MAG: CtsR family transcriptional regulator [Clostridia bacterium]|nr:CtsR family transcriptional regulator [Clostridia bacterium]